MLVVTSEWVSGVLSENRLTNDFRIHDTVPSAVANAGGAETRVVVSDGCSYEHLTDSISVAKVTVELDVSTAGAMRKMLVDLVKQGRFFLVVDLTGVDHVDSTGVGVFIGVLKRIRAHDGALALVLTSDGVLRYFRWAGLTKVFPIFGTVDTAVEFLGREVPNAHA